MHVSKNCKATTWIINQTTAGVQGGPTRFVEVEQGRALRGAEQTEVGGAGGHQAQQHGAPGQHAGFHVVAVTTVTNVRTRRRCRDD